MDATALETIRCDPQAEARFFDLKIIKADYFARKSGLKRSASSLDLALAQALHLGLASCEFNGA